MHVVHATPVLSEKEAGDGYGFRKKKKMAPTLQLGNIVSTYMDRFPSILRDVLPAQYILSYWHLVIKYWTHRVLCAHCKGSYSFDKIYDTYSTARVVQPIYIATQSDGHIFGPVHIATCSDGHIVRPIYIATPPDSHIVRAIHTVARFMILCTIHGIAHNIWCFKPRSIVAAYIHTPSVL